VGYNGVGFPLPTPGILTPETIPNCTQDLAGVRRLNIVEWSRRSLSYYDSYILTRHTSHPQNAAGGEYLAPRTTLLRYVEARLGQSRLRRQWYIAYACDVPIRLYGGGLRDA
jgi:hypothetical protein